ncbi:unnamed protein product [Pelagomonas calceolata]|uniref:Uncharacterized protein n=1 Tax=Pelagomonas calceolata TaxID=35677 RepID=A0A8J2SMB5_9STRA|nr:unnamed protein product [Pelagomonas calceolata]
MTAAPTKPRALRRLSQLHDAKSLGRDKELARRLQKGSAEPSPQSYKEQPRSPPGGRFTGKAPRPAPNDGTSPGRTADAYRAADALDLVEGKGSRILNPPKPSGATFGGRGADLFSIKDGPGPGAHDVRAADASQRAVWRQNKLASTASRFHADEIEAQRDAVGPGPAAYDTYVPSLAPKATLVGREGLKSFSEAKIEEQKWTPGAGAYDTTTPLSQVGGALGREKRGGAFAGESDGPGPGVDAMPSFLASVAETHSVSLPGASHETPLPGAAAVLAARQAVGESPGPAYDTAHAYNATHKAPGGISMRPQHLVATPLDRKKHPSPRFASPKAITARPPPAFKPPALPNAPSGTRFRVAPTAGRATRREYRRRYLASFRACRDSARAYDSESIKARASGRDFGSEGLGFATRRPLQPTRGAEAERAARLAKKLFAPDPAFKPARIATISKDEARFWADGIYDVYRPPRSDTMRPDPPPPPVTIPPPREDDGALFFDGVRALLDDAYRARLVKRRPLEPERGADHGVEVPPTTWEARDLVFLDDARERPTTDVDPGGVVAS